HLHAHPRQAGRPPARVRRRDDRSSDGRDPVPRRDVRPDPRQGSVEVPDLTGVAVRCKPGGRAVDGRHEPGLPDRAVPGVRAPVAPALRWTPCPARAPHAGAFELPVGPGSTIDYARPIARRGRGIGRQGANRGGTMTAATQAELPDGRVELIDAARIEGSPLFNHDLAPVPVARRNWTTYNYAALWISMAHCIPTYMLASGLMAQGMNWRQALFTIL